MSKRIKDLTGMRFGKLLVIGIEESKTDKWHSTFWKCKCECGKIVIARGNNLRQGYKNSCGCIKENDLTGKIFGRLYVCKPVRKCGRNNVYLCQCDCGNYTEVLQSNLIQGKSSSCGCYQKELASKRFSKHGKRNTRLYEIYYNMKSRCYNENNKRYDSYGGKGIAICQEWLDDFMNFYNWSMANGYSDELTIDRIDVNGNYCPENCRWASREQQSNNQRKTIFIEICGQKKSLKQWTNLMEWKYGKYSARSRRGVEIFSSEELKMIEEKLRKE